MSDSEFQSANQQQLSRVLQSKRFANKPRLCDLLLFLASHPMPVLEKEIAKELCGKDDLFNPQTDTIVRARKEKLVEALDVYYQTEGKSDPIVIKVVRGADPYTLSLAYGQRQPTVDEVRQEADRRISEIGADSQKKIEKAQARIKEIQKDADVRIKEAAESESRSRTELQTASLKIQELEQHIQQQREAKIGNAEGSELTVSQTPRRRTLRSLVLVIVTASVLFGTVYVLNHDNVVPQTRQELPSVVFRIAFQEDPKHPMYSVPKLATLAVSPDGKQVAYGNGRGPLQLWVPGQALWDPNKFKAPEAVQGTEGAKFPFFSQPDGENVGFFAQGKLKILRLADKQTDTKCDVVDPRGGTWYQDTIVFSAGPTDSLKAVSASKPLLPDACKVHVGKSGQRFPQFLPGGQEYFFNVTSDGQVEPGLYVGSLDGKVQSQLRTYSTDAIFVPSVTGGESGYILYRTDEGVLKASAFSPNQPKTIGPEHGLSQIESVMDTGYWGSGAFAASMGLLAYRPAEDRELVIVNSKGQRRRALGEPKPIRTDSSLALSPDHKRLAYSVGRGWKADVWVQELNSQQDPAQVTTGNGASWYPAWSADGKNVYYGFQGKGALTAKLMKWSREESREVYPSSPKTVNTGPWDLSSNGKWMLFRRHNPNDELWLLSLETGNATSYRSQDGVDFRDGRFSPDSEWIAYSSNREPGDHPRFQVYIARRTGGDEQIVSQHGGIKPRWGSDRKLYYLSDDGNIVGVDVTKIKEQHTLFGFKNDLPDISDYEPISDEEFVVNIRAAKEEPSTVIIVNWQSLLTTDNRMK